MSQAFRENVCIFQKIVHSQSGLELPQGYLQTGNYVETMELNGPKLMLLYRDPEHLITGQMQMKEYDELEVSFGDPWADDGASETETFVILSCRPLKGNYEINAMAKPVYELKIMADKAKIFKQRGIAEILKNVCMKGMKFSLGSFPVVNDYHLPPGMRPSTMLRQINDEQGSLMWFSRGTMHMEKFAKLWAKSPAATYEHGVISPEGKQILKYDKPSGQVKAQETKLRKFTGWDEVKGRVSTPLNNPLLAKLTGAAMQFAPGGNNPFVLGNELVGQKPAIDFIGTGSFAVEPGQAIALRWHQANLEDPLDEGMPDKVVVSSVCHWYGPQKYVVRVRGDVAIAPY